MSTTKRRPRGSVIELIVAHLELTGGCTAQDLAVATDSKIKTITCILHRLRHHKPKRVYIREYVYDQEGQRKFPRPIFVIGDKPDAPKPKRDPLARHREWCARRKAKRTKNFVFNLGAKV